MNSDRNYKNVFYIMLFLTMISLVWFFCYKYRFIHYDKSDIKITVSKPVKLSDDAVNDIMETVLEKTRCRRSWQIELLELEYRGEDSYSPDNQEQGEPKEVIIYGKANATLQEPFIHEHGWCIWRLRQQKNGEWIIIEDATNGV